MFRVIGSCDGMVVIEIADPGLLDAFKLSLLL
jgi:hypothetical protein